MKLKFNSIKGLVLVYSLFLICVLCSFVAIKYITLKRTEDMLLDNAQSQLYLLDNKLQTDLTGVQLKVWGLLSDKTLNGYIKNHGEAIDVTSEIRVEDDVKKVLKESVSSSSSIGGLDCFWLSGNKRISSANIDVTAASQNLLFLNKAPYKSGWHLIKNQGLYYVDIAPFVTGKSSRQNFDFLVSAKVKKDYLHDILNAFEGNDYLKVMLLSNDGNTYSNDENYEEVLKTVDKVSLDGNNYGYTLQSKNKKYQILMQRNPLSGIWIVSYFDMNKALQQYRQVNDLTTILLVALLMLGILLSIYFYRNFYTNLELMIHRFKSVENGDYSVRISKETYRPSEFEFMFKQFNKMLNNTQDLIEQLKTEMKLRENAEFRQLQAQINPHFLYNNLLFIMSMAKNSPEAVISMTEHLSAYYRYMTKQYSLQVDLEQECHLAEHYLHIMSLRKKIDFKVVLPNKLKKQQFMTLILQPLVENAIQHGIEQKRGAHLVEIIIEEVEEGFFVRVIDDGKGLTMQEEIELKNSLIAPEPKNQGSVGLWNVNHRLINQYGSRSQLKFSRNDFGGLTVYFYIPYGGLNDEGFTS